MMDLFNLFFSPLIPAKQAKKISASSAELKSIVDSDIERLSRDILSLAKRGETVYVDFKGYTGRVRQNGTYSLTTYGKCICARLTKKGYILHPTKEGITIRW